MIMNTKSGITKIFCYRDLLMSEEEPEERPEEEEEQEGEYYRRKHHAMPSGYGVTLYFVESTGAMPVPTKQGAISTIFNIIETITGHIKKDKAFDTGRAIEKLIIRNDPILTFVRMCINAGVKKTKCYFDSRTANISIRKQVLLALYEYLKLQDEIGTLGDLKQIPSVMLPPPFRYFETVQQFFEDELAEDAFFGQFEYVGTELSECDASDIESAGEIAANDFLFEMGELQSGTLKYFGHYHAATGKIIARMYPEFDLRELKKILKAR